jgi:putative peptide zinc metalloprotease protein
LPGQGAAAAPDVPSLPPLPPLREDLVLFPSSDHVDGSPSWVVQDPVRNKFARIGWLEFELLSHWQDDPVAVATEVARSTTLRPSVEDVLAFAGFLQSQGFVRLERARDLAQARAVPRKPGLTDWHWWLHNYLFFRIPLVRPDKWLQWLAPRLDWLFSPAFLLLLAGAGLLGGVLALRQGELFLRTFVDSFTLSGFVSFAIALMLAKTLHELGHAVVATRHGVRVAHMGVAFLVLWPMLYTDTSESWRLRNHRHRLRIAAAGIAVEMALAGVSLLGWALTAPGPLRSAFFYLATTSLVMTLALNSSPFMRFDGYYVVSDALDMPNLHDRAGAMARTWLRRTLLGWRDAWPEDVPRERRGAMIAFALGTWCYRLVLFLGIAIAVYLMFFKLLGIFLFAVEITWFIARPVWSELKVWIKRRSESQRGRARLVLLMLFMALGLLAFPWAHDIHAPAQLRAEFRTVYSPLASRIVALRAPGDVRAGEPVVVLDSPKLRNDAERARINVIAARAQLHTAAADAEQRRDQIGRLDETVQLYQAESQAAGQELARLRLSPGFDARWTDVEPTLAVGSWVRPQDPIGTLVDLRRWLVEAWVTERDVQYLRAGAKGRFHAANGLDAPQVVTVQQVDTVRVSELPHPALSSEHGGPIPATTEGRAIVPKEGLYLVRLQVEGAPTQARWASGRVTLEGARHSLLWDGVRYAISVLIRESGF